VSRTFVLLGKKSAFYSFPGELPHALIEVGCVDILVASRQPAFPVLLFSQCRGYDQMISIFWKPVLAMGHEDHLNLTADGDD